MVSVTALLVTVAAATLASAQGSGGGGMMNLTQLLSSTPQLSQLTKLLGAYPTIATSLASAKNVTLFAPNNAAIAALQSSGALNGITEAEISAILSYHVVPSEIFASAITATPVFAPTTLNSSTYTNVTGGQVVEARLDGSSVIITSGLKSEATVVKANQNYTGGVVHIIDSVLTIPLNVSTTAIAAELTALVGAVTSAGLVETLDTASDITIFAPSNAAFAAIGSAAGNLTMKQLAGVLEYHVINGTVAYSSLLSNTSVPTLAGSDVTITVEDGAVFVNAARVINADILVSGGVIHVIDSVLNPMNTTAKPDPSSNQAVPQYSGASSAPLAALTSGLPAPSTTISALVATTADVATGYSSPPAGALGTAGGGSGGSSGGSSSSSSSGVAAMPTGAIGAAALFGGAALVANW